MGKTAGLIAAIVLGAIAVFALLWWRAAERPDAPVVAGAPVAAPVAELPTAADSMPAALPAAPAGVSPLVDPQAAARSQLAIDFRGFTIAPELLERLAAGRVAEVVEPLWADPAVSTALALERVRALCAIHSVRQRDSAAVRVDRLLAIDGISTAARAHRDRIEATVRGEDAWRERFAADCERSGIGSPAQRERLRARIDQCAETGTGDCIVLAMKGQSLTREQSLARLQSAAVLGSKEAMSSLAFMLESGDDKSPAVQQSIRYWRQRLAEIDADYRANQLLCIGPDCRRPDDDEAMRRLLGAVREGSVTALTLLSVPPTLAAAYAAAPEVKGDVIVSNVSDVDAYAWAAMAERLTTEGCFGFWPNWAHFLGRTAEAERALSPAQLEEAKRAVVARWQAYGPQFAAQSGCAAEPTRSAN